MVESTKRLIKTLKLTPSAPKIVVFASSSDTASAFKRNMRRLVSVPVLHLLTTDDAEDSEEIVQRSKEVAESGIIVTVRSGEEGLNLSFADAIVHLDLPLSVARLEQRIGRLDRFGRRQGIIRHRILLPSDDDVSPWAAWYELLANGFLIFNRSISDIQFLLDSFEVQAFQTLLEGTGRAYRAQPQTFALVLQMSANRRTSNMRSIGSRLPRNRSKTSSRRSKMPKRMKARSNAASIAG